MDKLQKVCCVILGKVFIQILWMYVYLNTHYNTVSFYKQLILISCV